MTKPEPTLAGRLAAGESAAFEEVYDRYGRPIYRFLYARTGRADRAEDLLQTVMLRLVRYRRRLAGVKSVFAWLRTMARNELARKRGGPEAVSLEVDQLAVPEEDPRAEALTELRSALAGLAPERREVVGLKVYDRLTFEEIGAALRISPNTAASRYRYALADLRKKLGGES